MPSDSPTDRSVSTVLGQIADNLQHIVRAEVRLARVEIGDELKTMTRAAAMLAAAGAVGVLGCGVLLLAAVYALTRVMTPWAAALSVGGATLLVGGVLAALGAARLKHVGLPATVESVQETVQWAKTQAR
jgi:hypothetical protein